MAKNSITDHDWHDISYRDLPSWVKRNARKLDRQILKGGSFEYRRDLNTGKYQRRLRHRAPKLAWSSIRYTIGKILIGLTVIAMIVVTLSTVCLFISGTILLLATIIICFFGLGILVWSLNTLSKRRPGFVRVIMVLLISVIFLVFSSAYLDIRSLTDVKNSVTDAFTLERGAFRSSVDIHVERAELKFITVTEDIARELEKSANTKHVYVDGAILMGADGHKITLINNPDSTDPTWGRLKEFLASDDTDRQTYCPNSFVCADFAEMLHNNAEAAVIRAAYVTIVLGPSPYYPLTGGHALNAFRTTDRGLVYIDCTAPIGYYSGSADTIVQVEVGKPYVQKCVFPCGNWRWESMGTVKKIEVVEW